MKDRRIEDEYYQEWILRGVSRSFALTIPQLPARLRTPVANAYLLCRIADTIEDESALSTAATLASLRRFVAVVRGKDEPARLVEELLPQLSGRTSPAERGLVRNMERIIRVNARLQASQRCAIESCVEVMFRTTSFHCGRAWIAWVARWIGSGWIWPLSRSSVFSSPPVSNTMVRP